MIKGIIDKLPFISPETKKSLKEALDGTSGADTKLKPSGQGLISGMIKGIGEKLGLVKTESSKSLTEAYKGTSGSDKKLYTPGQNLINGLVNGMNNKKSSAKSASQGALTEAYNGTSGSGSKLYSPGQSLINGLINGMNSRKGDTKSASQSAMSNAYNGTSGSGSKLYSPGQSLISGMINGMNSKIGAAKTAASNAMINAKNGTSGASSKLYSPGQQTVTGYVNGIASKSGSASSAIRSVVNSAIAAAKRALGIRSPSRVFKEIGAFTTEGFAIGVTDNTRIAEDATVGLVGSVTRAITKPLAMMSDIMANEANLNPVITPVMDLANVEAGNRTIGQMLAENQALSLNAGVSAGLTANVGKVQNGPNNSDVVSAIKDLKDSLNTNSGASYSINGITYDDGSNITSAVETLVKAARMERRI